jgi:hypothetical protein
MSGSYGFSMNLELTATDNSHLHDRLLDLIGGNSNEEEILRSVFLDEEKNLIVFFGDNEDTWRYDYSQEVISYLKKIEDTFGGKFKGEFQWYSYDLHSDTTQEYIFDGEGGVKYNLTTESLDDDYYDDEEE